jgi:hypothetical protein
MESIFDRVKAAAKIGEVVERFGGVKLNRARQGLCPFHAEKTPSFSVKDSDNIFTCFGCGEHGSVIDFVAKIKGIEPVDAAKELAEYYGIEDAPTAQSKRVDKVTVPKEKTHPDAPQAAVSEQSKAAIKKYITECELHASETDYFQTRGITQDTVIRYHLGYDPKERRVVIPYSSEHEYYVARSTYKTHDDDLWIVKPKTGAAGKEPLFARAALYIKSGTLFIVESQFCAISIMQCGFSAVATCGTNGIGNLTAELRKKKPSAILVLCMDNDESGALAQSKLKKELDTLGIRYIEYNVAGKVKDPNELLQADPTALAANLQKAVSEAKARFHTTRDSISFAELCRMKLPPLKWAIKNVFPEGLHLIASMPKVGKSWMALGMCFEVANGTDFLGFQTTRMGTLYYALEDNYNSAQSRMMTYASGRPIPENAYLITDAEQTDTGFFEKLEQELAEHPDIGFIAVDTLQNIRGAEIKKGDIYGNDVGELKKIKKFALARHLSILLVHHLRKAKDDTDPFNNILGSNGLWGTVDTGIALTKKEEDDAETKLTIKGRGIKRTDMVLTFDADTAHWQQVGTVAQQAERQKRSEYETDPVVKTIKYLISKPPFQWTGTPTELLMASFDMDGVAHCITSESVGKAVTKYQTDLYFEGISTSTRRTSKKRTYTFYVKSKYYKQASIDETEDNGND